MQEMVNISNVPVSGHVTIELFEDDKCVLKESGTNVIKDSVAYEARRMWKSLVSQGIQTSSPLFAHNGGADTDWFRYVNLVDSAITPSASMDNLVFPMANGETDVIGYLDRLNTTVSDDKVGIVSSLSHVDNTGITFVYEWGLANAIGSFNTIVHAKAANTYLNSTSYKAYYQVTPVLKYDSAISASKVFAQASGAYCVYEAAGVTYIVDNFRIEDTNTLKADITNLTTGLTSTNGLTITNYGTVLPTMICVMNDGNTFFWAFADQAPNYVKVAYSDDANATFTVDALNIDSYYGMSIDAKYLYMTDINYPEKLYRFDWVDWAGTGSPASMASNYVTLTGSSYKVVVDYNGKTNAFSVTKNEVWEIDALLFNGTETITLSNVKFGSPSPNNALTMTGRYIDRYWYGNVSITNFVPGNVYEASLNCFCKVDIRGGRILESAHYKHGTTITKNNAQTLKITYRFNFA